MFFGGSIMFPMNNGSEVQEPSPSRRDRIGSRRRPQSALAPPGDGLSQSTALSQVHQRPQNLAERTRHEASAEQSARLRDGLSDLAFPRAGAGGMLPDVASVSPIDLRRASREPALAVVQPLVSPPPPEDLTEAVDESTRRLL